VREEARCALGCSERRQVMIERVFSLVCNRCKEFFDGSESMFHGECYTHAEIRKAAKAEGWRRIDGDDFCPSCLNALKGGK
jgi:hypothetical protein